MRYIDISKYQTNVDYAKLKNDCDGVIIRAVSTNSNGIYVDNMFNAHYNGCIANDIPVGVYFYTYATTLQRVDTELNILFDTIKDKKISLPVVIDIEDNSIKTIGKTAITDIIEHALKRIENAGYYAMYYSYKAFYDSYIDGARLINYDFWLRWYTSVYPQNYKFGIWQYTSSGRISAINTNVDISNVYKDYATIIKNAGLNHLTDFTTAQTRDEITEKYNALKKEITTYCNEMQKIIDDMKKLVL